MKSDHWDWTSAYSTVTGLATTFAPITVLVFWWSGMYRGSWSVVGLQDLTRACAAVGIVTLLGGTIVQLLTRGAYPLSVFAMYGVVNLLLTGSIRASYVVLQNTQLRANSTGVPVLIYGAGGKGVSAVRELFENPDRELRPIGFIDDDPAKRGKLVSGLPVLGSHRELPLILRAGTAGALLIACENVPAERLQKAFGICTEIGASLFRLDIRVRKIGDENAPAVRQAPEDSASVPSTPPVEPAWLETVHSLSAETCPSCQGRGMHRSKARALYERIWKTQTRKRLFRCHQCGWRGWLLPLEATMARATVDSVPVADLSDLDRLLPKHEDPERPELRIPDAV